MPKSWLCLSLLLGCCSSDNDTVEETYAFSDGAGRDCQATLEKTSRGSPSISQSVSCAGEGRECSAESRPCFVLSVDSQSDEIRNCPACCKGNSSSFVGADCSSVVCESDADCVYAEASCELGTCLCAGGSCE